MRSELHEPGRGWLTAMTTPARRTGALAASIVDAALGDDLPPVMAASARRDVAHASTGAAAMESRAAMDAGDGPLLKQLSQQLRLLEVQQRQIRRLLEQTEQRSRGKTARIDH